MKRYHLGFVFSVLVFASIGCYLWGVPSPQEGSGPVLAPQNSPAPTDTIVVPLSSPSASLSEPTGETSAEPSSATSIELELVVNGLEQPTGMVVVDSDLGRLFIIEKSGRIRLVESGQLVSAPFLDIRDRVGSSGSEQGLLGLAFDLNYSENGFLYVDYTDLDGNTVVSRFTATDSNHADSASEQVVLTQDQPAANHNGGQLAFGPDGYLYISFGDGGGGGDTFGNGQNQQSWLASILRIDVSNGLPYSVPSDNPFLSKPQARPELWAKGLRNPWRFSFDRQTGEMYIADVGQGNYEEVNVIPQGKGGENFGWPIMEGLHCYTTTSCNQSGYVLPVVEYDHSQGCSITGGYVYRGSKFPSLNGTYFFGDYCSGIIWGLRRDATNEWHVAKLLDTELQLSSFGEDDAGEIYVLDLGGGTVYQITVSDA